MCDADCDCLLRFTIFITKNLLFSNLGDLSLTALIKFVLKNKGNQTQLFFVAYYVNLFT